MPSAKITDLRIWNQNGEDATLFKALEDAISLVVSVDLSNDLIADLSAQYQVDFQLIDAQTNAVVVNAVETYQLPESWPYWWFSAGNNWAAPYTTAERWGLSWFSSPAVYGFRAILTASVFRGEDGWEVLDTLDVSEVRWFQLQPEFYL